MLCWLETALAVHWYCLPPVQYELAGHAKQLDAGPYIPGMHTQSKEELDMGGAGAFRGHRPIKPPEQKMPASQGVHGLPVDALPLYPGKHTHCVVLVAPGGEVAFSGHWVVVTLLFRISVTVSVVGE